MLSSQFYRCSSGIPEFRRHRNLFYAVVGEITSTPPSTGAGVREYCHNLYNGCFLKVEVNDFRLCVEGWIQLDVGFARFG